VALGGLIREDVQKVNDKTPLLGDVPLVGGLFRSQADQHIKRNLIIFVTATLMDPAGQPMAMAQQDLVSEMAGEIPADLPLSAVGPDVIDAPVEPPLP
jgi:general secretion pathway protein D